MARWDKITSRGNVVDRRSAASALGGLGITGLLLYMGLSFLMGGDPLDILFQVAPAVIEQQQTDTSQFEGEDEYEVFASTILGSANSLWTDKFSERGQTYQEPRLVLFRQATESGCGYASSEMGPHYCPLDTTIYLDETFFDELTRRFGAEGGDVAEAYVIAHEVAHHVQSQLGTLESRRGDSVNLELQADCYAGIWASSLRGRGILEPGEIREAMDAAAAVGDDRIQEATTGRVNPETWSHGSSEQRVSWFNTGYETGSIDACNTFESS